MKLEHIALNVPDPEAAARWYAEHLDMRVVRAGDAPLHIRFLADSAGATVLEFYRDAAGEVPDYAAMSPYTLHVAFAVDDIAATHQRLLSAGASAEGLVRTTPDGDLLAFVRDPWGVPLQLAKRREPLLAG